MKLETKYSIGDELYYYFNDDVIRKVKIKTIIISGTLFKDIIYCDENKLEYSEDFLFNSIEECKKNAIINFENKIQVEIDYL